MTNYTYFEDREQNVEFRKRPGKLQFRPIYTPNPTNYGQIVMNAQLRADGSWCDVPPHLVNKVPAF